MQTHPEDEEPGLEHDVNELPDDASEDTLEDESPSTDEDDLEAAQEDAAEEREDEGGYQ